MGQFKLGFETRAMKLGISISIAVILIHFGMGAPTENMKDDNDDDYDDYVYPDSSCGDYPEDDVVNGTSTEAITDYDSDNDSEKHGGKFCSGCPTGSVDYSR